jgi:hypothetical protein
LLTVVDSTAPIRLTLTTGEIVDADSVLVTVSAGVLKNEADTLFYPPLDQIDARKRQAIRTGGFGTVDKVFFMFEQKFWSDQESYIHLSAPGSNLDNPVGQGVHGEYDGHIYSRLSLTFLPRLAIQFTRSHRTR